MVDTPTLSDKKEIDTEIMSQATLIQNEKRAISPTSVKKDRATMVGLRLMGKLLISFKDAATTVVDSKACAAAEVAVIYPCVDAEEVTFRSEGVNAAGEMEISEAITEVDTTEKAIPTATSIKARDLKSAKIIER